MLRLLLACWIIVCRDAIQYIVQVLNEKAYRSLSYFSEWEPIGRHYPQLATAGLPLNSPEVLSHEVRRRVMRLGNEPANGEIPCPQDPRLPDVNKALPARSRSCQEYHQCCHLHSFSNWVREPKNENGQTRTKDHLSSRCVEAWELQW